MSEIEEEEVEERGPGQVDARGLVGIESGNMPTGELAVRFIFRSVIEVKPWMPGFGIEAGATPQVVAAYLRELAAFLDPDQAERDTAALLNELEAREGTIDPTFVELIVTTVRGGVPEGQRKAEPSLIVRPN